MNASVTEKQVQLGCGTLILIAIIVSIFSGGGDIGKLQKSVDELQMTVDRLEQKIDALSQAPPTPR